jgi:predicted site-specific integrase-resolvase
MAKIVVDTAEVLELEEAAHELGIGIATLFRWMKKGQIVPLKLGNRTYIPRSEIKRLQGEPINAEG